MNNKQSSVEWSIEKMIELCEDYDDGKIDYTDYCNGVKEVKSQAKEIHKEEINVTEDTSDGFHTFKTLYEIRKAYNVGLFNEWGKFDVPSFNVHKSRKHHNGEYPFGNDNWFIVCAELPSGQISNHYTMDNWDLFKIPEYEKALFPFDGHTTDDVINRLLKLYKL